MITNLFSELCTELCGGCQTLSIIWTENNDGNRNYNESASHDAAPTSPSKPKENILKLQKKYLLTCQVMNYHLTLGRNLTHSPL